MSQKLTRAIFKYTSKLGGFSTDNLFNLRADWEVYDLQDAQKVVDMPNSMARMEAKSDKNDEKLDRLLSLLAPNSYSDLAGSSTLGFI